MKFVFGIQVNMEVFYKLILSVWVNIARHAQSIQNKEFAFLCNISRKTWGMKLIFCLQINTKVFYKLVVSLWVCVARHAQSTQNNKFVISLQCLKEKVKDEFNLFACRWTSKVSSNWYYHFRYEWPNMPKLPKITSFLFLCSILRKKWVMHDEHENFLQLVL